MFRAEENKTRKVKKNKTKKKTVEAVVEIAALNKQKAVVRVVKNSTIYNVSSRIYYQYFTFKGLDYTRNIVYSLLFVQIFFQRSIFRRLTVIDISSSQWNVVSSFWVIGGNVRRRLMKPPDFWGLQKIITHFILHSLKMFLFRLLCL